MSVGMWVRAVVTGVLAATIVAISGLPFEWMLAISALLGSVVLVLNGSAQRYVRPLSFWQTAPVVLCLLIGAVASLLVLPFLLAAGKAPYYGYLVLFAVALGLYQVFTTNRATWFGLAEERGGSPAAQRSYVLSESVLADGRIAQIVRTHLWRGELLLPAAVAAALEPAPGGSEARGQRARDTRTELARQRRLPLRLGDDEGTGGTSALSRVQLCVDREEAQRARANSAEALAIDDLTEVVNAIVDLDEVSGRPVGNAVSAGGTVRIKLIRRGDQARQAIGHLNDGTPVAVDDAEELIGQRVEVAIRAVRQLPMGRMAFGSLDARSRPTVPPRPPVPTPDASAPRPRRRRPPRRSGQNGSGGMRP